MLHIEKKFLDGLSFIDLFAGLGGFRIALESLGAKCVYSNEWDKQAQRVYQKNFGSLPDDDITDICISYYRELKPTDFIIDLTGQLFIEQGYFVHMTESENSLGVSIDCLEISISSSYLQLDHRDEELVKFNADMNSYYSLLLRYAEEYDSK